MWSSTKMGSCQPPKLMGTLEMIPTDATPGIAVSRCKISSSVRTTCSFSFTIVLGIEMRKVCKEAGAEAHSGVLENGNSTKEDAGEERNQKCEEQDAPINANFMNARKSRGSDGCKNAQRGVSETQSDGAAEQSQNDAFEQEIRSDACAAGAQSASHGELLAAPFDTDQQQIGDVGASDQEDHADRTHQNPEDAADITDDIALERTSIGADMRVLEELDAEAGRRRKRAHNDWEHTSNVRVDLLDGDAWLEPGKTLVAEVAKMGFGAVKLEWDDYAGLFPVQEVKSLRQDADDLPGFAVYDDVAAHDGGIAAKFAMPIAIKKHDGFGGARRIILLGEAAAQQGRHAEERESAIRNAQGANLFWFGHAGHAHGVARVKTEILEGAILVAEDEVVGGGQLEFKGFHDYLSASACPVKGHTFIWLLNRVIRRGTGEVPWNFSVRLAEFGEVTWL